MEKLDSISNYLIQMRDIMIACKYYPLTSWFKEYSVLALFRLGEFTGSGWDI
jgi:hypothetical protein